MRQMLAGAFLALVLFTRVAGGQIVIDDFEDVSDWSGLTRDATIVMEGSSSGLWSDTVGTTGVRKNFSPAMDFSSYSIFAVWVYSHVANGAGLQLVLDSENEADDEGSDYYSREIVLDWEGWRYIRIPLEEFGVARNPLGWDTINFVSLSASGWGHEPMADTELNLDAMIVTSGVAHVVDEAYRWDGGDFVYEYEVEVVNGGGSPVDYSLAFHDASDVGFDYSVAPSSLTVPGGGSATAMATIRIPASVITEVNRLLNEFNMLVVSVGGTPVDALTLRATVPLAGRAHPALLMDADDATRINDWASRLAWASSRRDAIIADADGWPADFESLYGVSPWALPPEGGQWGMWYVCPTHGVYLSYEGPGLNVCPVDGENFTGWPYDQVIYARMHNALVDAAAALGQAYVLTGDTAYADDAAEILLAYADQYMSYPIHNVSGELSESGGRVLSQTLDESGWLIDAAWAYDLIGGSGVLAAVEREHVEDDLLRAAAGTILRHDSGESNWQSWHNAAIGAVGFALDDPRLESDAWNHGSSFLYQMDASVLGDGFWYEGSWGYHFYALRALAYTAEMALRAGLDPLASDAFLSMYTAPVYFAEPDGSLPAFNDSGRSSLHSQRRLYEAAYRWTSDPVMATPLDPSSRPLDALLWGAEDVDVGEVDVASESLILPESGFVVMRAGMSTDDPVYLALDYGPHGGWHGHYDKLGFVLYGRGMEAAVDPGTHSYALDIHDDYDRTTVAHNTVVVDMSDQAAATGNLIGTAFLPDVALAGADAGEAYESATIEREILVTDRYVIDEVWASATDGATHRFDWILHTRGTLLQRPEGFSGFTFGPGDGYGYLDGVEAADVTLPARFSWDYSDEAGSEVGSLWASEAGIDASFTVSDAEASGGSMSGRMHYDFGAVSGYIIFTIPAPESVPADAVPDALHIDVRGDGSGNSLAFRLYDTTNERFVHDAGILDFTGWQHFEATDPETWSHYLGDDDGVLDPPVDSVAVAVGHETGGATVSEVYVDDIVLVYGGVEYPVADFEIQRRFLHLYVPATGSGTGELVTGTGPSSWSEEVPFVMRRGGAGGFISLIEPLEGDSSESVLRELETSSSEVSGTGYVVENPDYIDAAFWSPSYVPSSVGVTDNGRSVGYVVEGLLGFCRYEGGAWTRMGIVEGDRLECEDVLLLESSVSALELQVDVVDSGLRVDVHAELDTSAEIRILAPDASSAFLNGSEVEYTRDGDYIIINASPTTADGWDDPDSADASTDGDGDDGSSGRGCGCTFVR